jgi:hypothetical protein
VNPPDEHGLAGEAFEVHEALVVWLRRTYPRIHSAAILTALSYEIGRICGRVTEGKSDVEVDAMLHGIHEAMKEHVRAYRAGLKR